MPLTSMTGFADLAGSADGLAWTWEARSVNGRGLDLRLRLPEGFEALDAPVRAGGGDGCSPAARSRWRCGSRAGAGGGAAAAATRRRWTAAVAAALAAAEAAAPAGLDLAPMTAADLLAVRGVIEAEAAAPAEDAGACWRRSAPTSRRSSPALAEARAAEGAALAATARRPARPGRGAGRARRATTAEAPGRPEPARCCASRLEAVLAAARAGRRGAARPGAGADRGQGRRDRGARPAGGARRGGARADRRRRRRSGASSTS